MQEHISYCLMYCNRTTWKNKDGSVIDIDCGAGFPNKGGCLGCLRLNDLKEFYIDPELQLHIQCLILL